jgi:hypothetical protein
VSNLDPRIEAIRERYGLERDDFWKIPQNKQWVCKHAALEVIATKAKVEWQIPQIIQADTANGIAVMVAVGKMGDRVEWATGEASPKNNKNAYPWAMAEKRAKDRVVLKLVGIHGLVYSEDEIGHDKTEDTQQRESPKAVAERHVTAQKNEKARETFAALQSDMRQCKTKDDLGRWWRDEECKTLRSTLPTDWQVNLKSQLVELGDTLPAAPGDTVGAIQDQFPGSTVTDERIINETGRELHPLEAAE